MNLPLSIQSALYENPWEGSMLWGVQIDEDGKIIFASLFTGRTAAIGYLDNALNFPGRGEFYVLRNFLGVVSIVLYYAY